MRKIKSFVQHIVESEYLVEVSLDDDMLGHLTHTKDIPHEAPESGHNAVELIRQFHNHRRGVPSTVTASIKHDGGASVHVIHHSDGRVGVSDKSRLARKTGPVIAYSDDEIDQHFGKYPRYAESLKHLRNSSARIVSPGHHVQGDILWAPGVDHSQTDKKTTYTPNRITYTAPSNQPVGFAVHTQITNGIAHAPDDKALKKGNSGGVFLPRVDFKPEEHNYSDEAQKEVEYHLSKADDILGNHSTDHLTKEHREHFTIYNNRVARGHRTPTTDGYIAYLKHRSEDDLTKAAAPKSEAGRQKHRDKFAQMIDYVEKNREHFDRSLQLRHHLQTATDAVLSGIEHKDLHSHIDGTPANEGVVLRVTGKTGLEQPVAKLVHSDVQYALGNNPRFPNQKGTINEEDEGTKAHAWYGKARYPHLGHAAGISEMKNAAAEDSARTFIGLSNEPGPLGIKEKKKMAERTFDHPVETGEDHTKNVVSYLSHLHKQGVEHLTLHCGSDRIKEYKNLLDKYNGKADKKGFVPFAFKSYKLKQVGEDREESSVSKQPKSMSLDELKKTASSTRILNLAKSGDFENFKAYHPNQSSTAVRKIYSRLRTKSLKESEDENLVNITRAYLKSK